MAKDLHHYLVKTALEKEGWVVTNDPYYLSIMDSPDYEIDLAAEMVVGAEKEGRKIAVEIKSFVAHSIAHEFNKVLGQYLGYLLFLSVQEPDRKLYLAIPQEAYLKFFTKQSTVFTLSHYHINLMIFDIQTQTIISWHEN